MVRWSKRAQLAIRKLFQPLQDIDIYVEDDNDEVFYSALFGRLCKEANIRSVRVFSLGSRKSVIEGARAHCNRSRRALFVIDGDLEWVRGLPLRGPSHLYRHNAYCIENLILCQTALAIILSQDAVISEELAKTKLNYLDWLSNISDPLVELFAAYATANHFCPEVRTVSTGVGVMCTAHGRGRPPKLSRAKVAGAKDRVLEVVAKSIGKESTNKYYHWVLQRIKGLATPTDAISGKDFLLPLIQFHISGLGSKINRRSLRLRLASACNLERFRELKAAIIERD